MILEYLEMWPLGLQKIWMFVFWLREMDFYSSMVMVPVGLVFIVTDLLTFHVVCRLICD